MSTNTEKILQSNKTVSQMTKQFFNVTTWNYLQNEYINIRLTKFPFLIRSVYMYYVRVFILVQHFEVIYNHHRKYPHSPYRYNVREEQHKSEQEPVPGARKPLKDD